MGLAADDRVNGLACDWCGAYFVKEHGHPALCSTCWQTATPEQRKQTVKARYREI